MFSRREARTEVEAAVKEAAERNGGSISRDWATQFLIDRHASEFSDKDGFAFFAMAAWVQNAIREYCNVIERTALRAEATLTGQLRLEFPNLKDYYAVERGEELVSLPVNQLTDAELLTKETIYRSQASSLIAEADDLQRYRESRSVTSQVE